MNLIKYFFMRNWVLKTLYSRGFTSIEVVFHCNGCIVFSGNFFRVAPQRRCVPWNEVIHLEWADVSDLVSLVNSRPQPGTWYRPKLHRTRREFGTDPGTDLSPAKKLRPSLANRGSSWRSKFLDTGSYQLGQFPIVPRTTMVRSRRNVDW